MIPKESGIFNCTPHDINIYDENGENVICTFQKSGFVARLDQEPQEQIGELTTTEGIKVVVYSPQKFKEVIGLPSFYDKENAPAIIVSMIVAEKLRETSSWLGDVYGPDMGNGAVRGPDGQIKGTTRLIQYCARRTLNV